MRDVTRAVSQPAFRRTKDLEILFSDFAGAISLKMSLSASVFRVLLVENFRAVPVEPIAAILDAFRFHQVVAVGDAHGNEQGEAFRLALIRDPRFAATVNDIIVEFGNAQYQDLMDRFVRGEDIQEDALRRAWQDTTQPQAASLEMPEVFRAVNASLLQERQLRILLGDPPIDWESIRTPGDVVGTPVCCLCSGHSSVRRGRGGDCSWNAATGVRAPLSTTKPQPSLMITCIRPPCETRSTAEMRPRHARY